MGLRRRIVTETIGPVPVPRSHFVLRTRPRGRTWRIGPTRFTSPGGRTAAFRPCRTGFKPTWSCGRLIGSRIPGELPGGGLIQ